LIRFYYGWRIVAVAALAMVGTLPGRTQGLGLITEPLLADLSLDRVSYAGLNFWATIIGALGAIGVGRLIDRFGARVVLTVIAFLLGAVVCVMSFVTSVASLAVALLLTRAIGQSALSVVSIAMVGQWFSGRGKLNAAMAIYSVALSIGFMIAFPVVGALIQQWGWRFAWMSIGIALIGGLAPIAWLVVRRPDPVNSEGDGGEASGHAWTEAIGTPAFWVFAIGTALYGLVASGIGLFNESILAERGFGPAIYYQSLVVTAMTALAGNFLGGWLATQVSLTRLMAVSLFVLAGGLIALPHVSSLGAVMAWATTMGLGGGLVMVLFFSVWPEAFGRRHLGQIQGAAQALTVVASAVGPLLLAWCVDLTGSYAAMFRTLAGVIALTAVTALAVTLPRRSAGPLPAPQRAS
jgi:MFS family permease